MPTHLSQIFGEPKKTKNANDNASRQPSTQLTKDSPVQQKKFKINKVYNEQNRSQDLKSNYTD